MQSNSSVTSKNTTSLWNNGLLSHPRGESCGAHQIAACTRNSRITCELAPLSYNMQLSTDYSKRFSKQHTLPLRRVHVETATDKLLRLVAGLERLDLGQSHRSARDEVIKSMQHTFTHPLATYLLSACCFFFWSKYFFLTSWMSRLRRSISYLYSLTCAWYILSSEAMACGVDQNFMTSSANVHGRSNPP